MQTQRIREGSSRSLPEVPIPWHPDPSKMEPGESSKHPRGLNEGNEGDLRQGAAHAAPPVSVPPTRAGNPKVTTQDQDLAKDKEREYRIPKHNKKILTQTATLPENHQSASTTRVCGTPAPARKPATDPFPPLPSLQGKGKSFPPLPSLQGKGKGVEGKSGSAPEEAKLHDNPDEVTSVAPPLSYAATAALTQVGKSTTDHSRPSSSSQPVKGKGVESNTGSSSGGAKPQTNPDVGMSTVPTPAGRLVLVERETAARPVVPIPRPRGGLPACWSRHDVYIGVLEDWKIQSGIPHQGVCAFGDTV